MKQDLIDDYIMPSAHREATFAVYKTVHREFALGNISLKRASNLIGLLLGAPKSSWRVVGITPAALELFRVEQFRKRPRGVQRAHLFNRIDTSREILETQSPLIEAELFDHWNSRDMTILSLSGENKNIAGIDAIHIENPNGELFSNSYIGYSFKANHEGVLLSSLWENMRVNIR